MRKPYVILIGSASGIGKSTIAAELAKKLEIKHLIETDFIRAVVRGIIGKDYAPALHTSSYNAYKTLRDKEKYDDNIELICAGIEEHASFVIPAIEQVIRRAISDFDDVIIEGVHLIPGLINIDQFKSDANVYFFILSSDEESHKGRFVKRAIQIHRGGKQLDHFTENRIIHDFLIKKADEHNVPVIQTESVESTLKKMLRNINRSCETILLKNTIDELKDVVDIVIRQNNGSLERVSYKMHGFKDPLIREINITEANDADKFIKAIEDQPFKKDEISQLYDLSEYRQTKICAANKEDLNRIIGQLKEKGFIYEMEE